MGEKTARGTPSANERATKYEQVAEAVSRLIEAGTYRPGDRIPSVRQLSLQQKVSITTVLQAYVVLENRGLIEARPQSGYYVRALLPPPAPEPEISAPQPDPSQVSVRELVMMVLHDTCNPNLVRLGTAVPNPSLLPTAQLTRILTAIARRTGVQSGEYDFPPGIEALRIQVARRAVAAGCQLSPSDIVTTCGCIEAVELSLRAVCRPGDTVAIESPSYFGLLQALEALGLRALEIPTHPRNGISLEALRFAVDHLPVHACLVNPNFHNPLGSCPPDDLKKDLVSLLARHEIPLIENDVSGELYFGDQRPTVARAYDRKGMVLLCSSFSKDLAPGYRVGWVAPGKFKSAVEWHKFTTNIGTPTLAQMAIAEFLAGGCYDRHLRRIRRAYARQVGLMTQALIRSFPNGTRVTRPQGGFVLWIQLPPGVDSLLLYRLALRAGIAITPGHIFSASDRYREFIRLNAAFWGDREERAVERLGQLIASFRP